MRLTFLFFLFSLVSMSQDNFKQSKLVAWCIVPYDSEHRTPVDRLKMLDEIGLKHYAYDWRHEHLETFDQEIKLVKKSAISLDAVWIWIDERNDKIGQLSADNLKLIQILKDNDFKTVFWIGFNENFFENLKHSERVKKGSEMIQYISEVIGTNSKIALYGHGENEWFGEPENEIEIIKESQLKEVKIVYSFHHAHLQINRFPSMLKTMLPYLEAINLNGLDMEKGKILTIGKGKYERELIKMIQTSGYKGKIGILGHDPDRDVKLVLQENLLGLQNILNSIK
jgi:hypothetical protein